MCIFTSTGAWKVGLHLGFCCYFIYIYFYILYICTPLHPLQGHCLTWNVGMHRNATSSAQSVVPSRYSKIPCSQLFLLLVFIVFSFFVFIVSKVDYVSVVVKPSLNFFIEMSERTQMSLDFLIELRL